jgi:hypothetical protein
MLNPKPMEIITAVLTAGDDGVLHLPVPPEWRDRVVRVKAELEPSPLPQSADETGKWKGFGCLSGKISMSADFDESLEGFTDYMG